MALRRKTNNYLIISDGDDVVDVVHIKTGITFKMAPIWGRQLSRRAKEDGSQPSGFFSNPDEVDIHIRQAFEEQIGVLQKIMT